MSKFKNLDPLLSNQLRLAVMSLLISVDSAEFTFLKEATEASSGNLSVQLSKLEESGYIHILKTYQGKIPKTICSATKVGIAAFQKHFASLNSYLPKNQEE